MTSINKGLVFWGLFILGCQKPSYPTTKLTTVPKNTPCTIQAKGINNIVVEKSTLEDVLDVFRGGEIQRKRVKRLEKYDLSQGGFEQYIAYKSLGLYFSNYKVSKRARTNVVQYIYLKEGCPCVSPEGLKVGDAYADFLSSWGEPLFEGKSTSLDGQAEYTVNYPHVYLKLDQETAPQKVLEIVFY